MMGPCRGRLPADPSKLASPNANTPPSALAKRYPPPSAVATPEKTGEFSGCGSAGAALVDGTEADHPRVVVGVCRLGRAGWRGADGGGDRQAGDQHAGNEDGGHGHCHQRRDHRGQTRVSPAGPPDTQGASASAHDHDSARCVPPPKAGAVTKSLRVIVQPQCRRRCGPLGIWSGLPNRRRDPFGRLERAHGRMGP